MLFTSTRYPYDYGFVENTLSLDGDPLDALGMLDEPTFPGCVVSCRAIGMLGMTDEMVGEIRLNTSWQRKRLITPTNAIRLNSRYLLTQDT